MASPSPQRVHVPFTSRKLKSGVFSLEALNSLGTTYFFYDIYFYTRDHYHFHELQNLLLAALLGAVYIFGAFYGGRFAQRFGYLTAVQCGAGLMTAIFLTASHVENLAGFIALLVVATVGQCLTWPALEAATSEGEPAASLKSLVGMYNVTWSGFGAIAYFTGGAMMERWGQKSIFYVGAIFLILEIALAFWLQREAGKDPAPPLHIPLLRPTPEGHEAPVSQATFLKMALLANPLAYLAINTVIPTIPSLAGRFQLSAMKAGFVCSIWLFVRTAAFIFLRLWPRWHYRFRYLAGSFLAMILSFEMMLRSQDLWTLVISQTVFGLAIGLIYYSSLFYSMDVGETKGEHGGIHESAIGAGNAAGPGIAALALAAFPNAPGNGAMAVCVLLFGGLGVLYWMRFRHKV